MATSTRPLGGSRAPLSTTSNVAPNQTLYISNLNDKIHKPDLKIALYTLFSTYGVVLDVIALKTMKMRGQAHVAFRDIASASSAMRACQGMVIFGREMKIQYAKSKSDTIAKLDGTYRMPSLRTADDSSSGATGTFAPLPGQKKGNEEDEEMGGSGPGLGSASANPNGGAATGGVEAHGTKRPRDESESEQSDGDVEMEVDDDD
ncbi:U2 snRNP complex subunit msl1 [Orbilia ellipsospora]|uniref:U2 snRNP complex subunit msl1 n=1 Tax=Orbilia ellipsospora TaxID=2528407 RepID=A0AAV9WXV4_9PEZI